jgi:hypothetical protein
VPERAAAHLKYAGRSYGEIGRQLLGLYWKNGGPIVGAQIENEYHERGPAKGAAAHLLMLRRMAREAGIDAPFYSITGWDAAIIPDRGVIPVFGWRTRGVRPTFSAPHHAAGVAVFHFPRVKSGNCMGAPPCCTEASLSGPGALHAAAS